MRRAGRHPFATRFIISTLLLAIIGVAWALASPNSSGPDEEAQIVKAAALAHGTLIGTPAPSQRSQGVANVVVPQTVVNALPLTAAGQPDFYCNYYLIDQPACSFRIQSNPALTLYSTYEARYPPLYYAITAIPWLVTSNEVALRWMRVCDALVVAALLGLAFASVSAFGRSGLLTATTGFIITPTVLYLGGVVNPSGMEIGGGIAVWATLVVLVFHRSEDPPRTLLAAYVIGAVGLCAARPLSTLWLALALVTMLALRPGTAWRLLRMRRVLVAIVLSLLVALVSGIYVLVAKSYEIEKIPSRAGTTAQYLAAIAGHAPRVLVQVVGAFGAPDFAVPLPVVLIWVVGVSVLIGAAVLGVGGRDGLVVAAMTAVFGFILPFAIVYSHVRADGVIWQGRYALPLIAGIPLVAAAVVHERWPMVGRLVRRLAAASMLAWLLGTLGAFYWFLRRYTVGLSYYHYDAFRLPGSWRPPIPATEVYAIGAIASALLAAWVLRQATTVPGARPARSLRHVEHAETPVPV